MIKYSANFHCVLAFYSLICIQLGNSFRALTDVYSYVNELYLQEWNKDENCDLDPASADASARQQICDDVSHSVVFGIYGMKSVTIQDAFDELKQPKYAHIFHRIYSPTTGSENSDSRYTYTNPYTLQAFRIKNSPLDPEASYIDIKEYVFVCLLRKVKHAYQWSSDSGSSDDYFQEYTHENDPVETDCREDSVGSKEKLADENPPLGEPFNDIIPVYVTKAYDLKFGLHVHRYVHLDASKFDGDELLLAERPANTDRRPDFNVELHYLELRKHYRPALTARDDPILRFDSTEHSSMRLTRICTILTSSSYFQRRFGKVRQVYNSTVLERQVSFRTAEGKRGAYGKQYKEFVVPCTLVMSNKHLKDVYVSRAYNPFQVFLYLEDPVSCKLHLEMLATDVSLAQDRHNLGDVEI